MATPAELLAGLRATRRELKFNADQPRADDGEWTSGGGGGGSSGRGSESSGGATALKWLNRIATAGLLVYAGLPVAAAVLGYGTTALGVYALSGGAVRVGVLVADTVPMIVREVAKNANVPALVAFAALKTVVGRLIDRRQKEIDEGKSARSGDAVLAHLRKMRDLLAKVDPAKLETGKANSAEQLLVGLRELREELKYNPNQPRDDHGRFGSGGGGGSSSRSGNGGSRSSGRIPKNSIRAVAHWLQRAEVQDAIAGLGLSLAPAAISFMLGAIAEHSDNEQLHDTVQRAVSSLATRLGTAFEAAKTILRTIVDKLMGLARTQAAPASPPPKPARSVRMPRAANIDAPRSRARPYTRHSAVFDRRRVGEIDVKASDEPDILPVLQAMRDALDQVGAP